MPRAANLHLTAVGDGVGIDGAVRFQPEPPALGIGFEPHGVVGNRLRLAADRRAGDPIADRADLRLRLRHEPVEHLGREREPHVGVAVVLFDLIGQLALAGVVRLSQAVLPLDDRAGQARRPHAFVRFEFVAQRVQIGRLGPLAGQAAGGSIPRHAGGKAIRRRRCHHDVPHQRPALQPAGETPMGTQQFRAGAGRPSPRRPVRPPGPPTCSND